MTVGRKATAAMLGVLAATAAFGAAAGPASAYEWNEAKRGTPSGNHPWDCIGTTGGIACFQQYGDLFWVKDTKSDRRSAIAVWRTEDGRNGVCRNTHGSGTWAVCNKDLGEHQWLELWAARHKNSTGITDWSGKFLSATS